MAVKQLQGLWRGDLVALKGSCPNCGEEVMEFEIECNLFLVFQSKSGWHRYDIQLIWFVQWAGLHFHKSRWVYESKTWNRMPCLWAPTCFSCQYSGESLTSDIWSRRLLLIDPFFGNFPPLFGLLCYWMKHLPPVMCHEHQLEMWCYWGEPVTRLPMLPIGVLTFVMFTPCSGQSQVLGNHGHMAVYTWSQKQINWLQIWNNNDRKTLGQAQVCSVVIVNQLAPELMVTKMRMALSVLIMYCVPVH